MQPTDKDRIAELQRQIVEIRRDMEAMNERNAALLVFEVQREVKAQTLGRLPTPEVLAWAERGLATSIKRSQSIRELLFDSFKMSAWAGLAFIAWSVWEGIKAKIGAKTP